MPERVIDILEVIDIGQQNGAAAETPVGPQQILDRMLEAASILEPGERVQQGLVLRPLQALGQNAHFTRAGLKLARELERHGPHLLRALDNIVDDLSYAQIVEVIRKPVHMGLQRAIEVGRFGTGRRSALRSVFENRTQALLQGLQNLHVAGNDVLRIQPLNVIVGQRDVGSQSGFQQPRQLGIQARDVLVPEGIA